MHLQARAFVAHELREVVFAANLPRNLRPLDTASSSFILFHCRFSYGLQSFPSMMCPQIAAASKTAKAPL